MLSGLTILKKRLGQIFKVKLNIMILINKTSNAITVSLQIGDMTTLCMKFNQDQ